MIATAQVLRQCCSCVYAADSTAAAAVHDCQGVMLFYAQPSGLMGSEFSESKPLTPPAIVWTRRQS